MDDEEGSRSSKYHEQIGGDWWPRTIYLLGNILYAEVPDQLIQLFCTETGVSAEENRLSEGVCECCKTNTTIKPHASKDKISAIFLYTKHACTTEFSTSAIN